MKRAQRSQKEIAQILSELNQGTDMDIICLQHGISKATLYRWRKKAQEDESEKNRHLKDAASENSRLRVLLADAALEIQALKEKISFLEK
jgi:putative transposase